MPPPKLTAPAAGLEAVTFAAPPRPTALRTPPEPKPGDVLSLDLDLLDDNPFQPRTEMDPAKLSELAASIQQSGLLQPIAVRPAGPGRYQVVAGHRRLAAYRKLRAEAKADAEKREYQLIRAHVVAAVSDHEMAVAAYVENAQRDNLTPIEEANALDQIRKLGSLAGASEVAQATGQPERRVRRLFKLLAAPPVVRDATSTGLLVEVHQQGETPRRERRRLDLFAALEFARLFEHFAKKKPRAAAARVTAAMQRALSCNWGLRRIESHVEAVLAGRAPPEEEADEPGQSEQEGTALSTCVGKRLVIYRGRLGSASPEQLLALALELDALAADIRSRLADHETAAATP